MTWIGASLKPTSWWVRTAHHTFWHFAALEAQIINSSSNDSDKLWTLTVFLFKSPVYLLIVGRFPGWHFSHMVSVQNRCVIPAADKAPTATSSESPAVVPAHVLMPVNRVWLLFYGTRHKTRAEQLRKRPFQDSLQSLYWVGVVWRMKMRRVFWIGLGFHVCFSMVRGCFTFPVYRSPLTKPRSWRSMSQAVSFLFEVDRKATLEKKPNLWGAWDPALSTPGRLALICFLTGCKWHATSAKMTLWLCWRVAKPGRSSLRSGKVASARHRVRWVCRFGPRHCQSSHKTFFLEIFRMWNPRPQEHSVLFVENQHKVMSNTTCCVNHMCLSPCPSWGTEVSLLSWWI